MKPLHVLLLALLLTRAGFAEDIDLRNRAEQIMNRALVASQLTTPLNIRTVVNFSATVDGAPTAGSYTRTRAADHGLREDFVLGDYRMARINDQGNVATQGNWVDIPYTLRKIMEFVPYLPIRFEDADVVTAIDETRRAGKAAQCIQFVTVKGDDRNPGEICVDRDTRTVIEWHDRDHAFAALEYHTIKGAQLPARFTYREGDKLSIDATVEWTLFDARPDEALTAPEDWRHAFFCKSFAMPVPKAAPQPAARGGIDAPVITVPIRVHVRPDGTVSNAEVLKPVREDLDAEAVSLVKTWTYQPGKCEGHAQDFAIDAAVHFQGR